MTLPRFLFTLLGLSGISPCKALSAELRTAPYLRASRPHTAASQISLIEDSDVAAAVQNVTKQFVKGAPESVLQLSRSIAAVPSENHPFIFFHLRKAAGSTVRKQLSWAAKKARTRAYIACYDGVPCETYSPPQGPIDDGYSVFGGHFTYPSTLKSLFLLERAGARISVPKLNFDCLVLLRKPTSRVQSCWNYRMVQEGSRWERQSPMASMSPEDLATKLPTAMSFYGEGCNNEALRLLSSSSSEEVINTLTSDPDHMSPLAPVLLQESVEHMQRCVVGVVERCEDTIRAVKGYFPWFSNFDCKGTKLRRGDVDPSKLTADVEAEVAHQNMLEQSIYEVGNALLDAQLLQLKSQNVGTDTDTDIHEQLPSQSWLSWLSQILPQGLQEALVAANTVL